MTHDKFYQTDGGLDVMIFTDKITNSTSVDDILDLCEDLKIMHSKQPFANVEYAYLNNLLDSAFDELLAIENEL